MSENQCCSVERLGQMSESLCFQCEEHYIFSAVSVSSSFLHDGMLAYCGGPVTGVSRKTNSSHIPDLQLQKSSRAVSLALISFNPGSRSQTLSLRSDSYPQKKSTN